MLFWTTLKVCIKSLISNKLRSFLAMLGIIIGVGAVIAMLAMGAGAKKQILDRISAMGTNLLVIRPGQSGSRGVVSGSHENLTLEDAQAILNESADTRRISPLVRGQYQIKYMNQNTRCDVMGVALTYFPIRDFAIERGRMFTESEVDGMARVAVVGPETAKNLFGHNDPIGEQIKIKGINFKVIGLTKAKGDQGWFNPDDQAFIPYTTAMKQMVGTDYLREIDVQAKEGVDLKHAEAQITKILRRRHQIAPLEADDFSVRNQADMVATANEVGQTFTVLLGGIASISLLVGGIGIMNIMLVTVTERTKEIGIRKAIGAKENTILLQFLIESIIISGLGGIIGVGIGLAGASAIANFTSFAAQAQLRSVLVALSFSVVVGVFFGFYPARRAAGMDPVEALRYE